MRRIILAIAFLVAATSLISAQSQDSGWQAVQDASGKHKSYITNDWFDNWYIGIGGGAITSFSKMTDPRFSPEFEANILKWFTPEIGVRFGYMGQWGKEYINTSYNPYNINHSALPFDGQYGGPGTLSYNMYYLNGNILWNVTNTIRGYDRARVYNCSPYLNFGYMRMYDGKDHLGIDNEIGFGAGLYNTFRIGDRWVFTLDARHINTASRYKTKDGTRTNFVSLSAGIAYNIFRTYWNRTSTVVTEAVAAKAEAEAAIEEVKVKEKELVKLEQKVEAQQEKIEEQKQAIDETARAMEMDAEALKRLAASADQILYFDINNDRLSRTEKLHLADYVRAILDAQPDHVFYLTGSADKGTGSMDLNTMLSAARAQGVQKMLVEQFGVKPQNVVIKSTVVSDRNADGALDRCVIIESK